jgi:hypothetical protein
MRAPYSVKVGVFLFHHENNLIKYPNKISTIPKSESPNVVPSNPSEPRTGSKSAGKNEIKIPLANAPKMAPRLSPVTLPNTPAAASVKKCGINPGTIPLEMNSYCFSQMLHHVLF